MNKKRGLMFVLCLSISLLLINFASAEIIERGSYWNTINNGDGSYSLKIYSNIINILNGSGYIPINTQIKPSNYSNFVYELTSTPYEAYFRNNSNTAGAVRFEKDGYFFTYDLSGGGMYWANEGIADDASIRFNNIGFSNSVDSYAKVTQTNEVMYPGAFYNTNVTYELEKDIMKENFILYGVPSFKDYLYLRYSGTVEFNKSLDVCANGFCYKPSGSEDDFETSGRIDFRDSNGTTIFYLPVPTITDSANNTNTITGKYRFKGSNAHGIFYLYINKTFLETAVFPVYIDPSVKIIGNNNSGGGDAYVSSSNPNTNYGDSNLLKTGDTARAYLLFNISEIPSNQKIDNASLCLYVLNTKKTQLINASQVYADFNESSITWNNQPCGANFDNSSACNLTRESSVQMNSSFEYTWMCWKVTNTIGKAYGSGNKKVSIVLYTSDLLLNSFSSKEEPVSSQWPYLNITYSLADIVAPSFSNYTETPDNNSLYVSGQTYRFNVAINESNINSVWIEFNGINYTNGISNISNVYTFTKTNLAAGTYSYRWWANDTLGNLNSSEVRYYTINKASQSITALLNGANSNLVINYPQQANASYSGINYTAVTIKINSTQINIGQNYTFAAGNYFVNYSVAGNQNYTSYETYLNLTINKATPALTFLANGQTNNLTLTYSQQVNISAVSNYGTISLDKDGINYLENNALNVTLATGSYIFRSNVTGNQNYSDISYRYYNITINKANPSVNMNITGNSSITYGTVSDFNGTETSNGDSDCTYSLDRANQIYGVGTWIFNYSTSGCANYTTGSVTKQLTVNKATPVMTITGNSSIVYGTAADVTATENNNGDADLVYEFYRNGVLISSSDTSVLSAGNYDYEYLTVGGQNYTSNWINFGLIVIKKNSTTSLNFSHFSPQVYGTLINVSCSSDNPEETVRLYRNSIEVTDENYQLVNLAAETYNYTCNISESQNYSSTSSFDSFVIEKADGDVKLYLNGLEENVTVWSIDGMNITATTLYGGIAIYKNGEDITNENGLNITRSVGDYNITAVSSGDENHSSLSVTRKANIIEDLEDPSLALSTPQDGDVYGYKDNINLELEVSDENLQSCWYNINNGNNITISNCANTPFNVAGNGNYTLYLYANDRYGNENRIEVNFSINLDAPTIRLNFPISVYLDYTNITFRYNVSDIDLDSCELWGNFDGEIGLKLNQTNNTLLNYSENTFNLILPDGTYTWRIRCNDSQEHLAYSGSTIFYIDTTIPSITINEPKGTKNSRVVTASWSISDASPISCKYNIYRGLNIEVSNTSVGCYSNSTNFNVTVDADFTFNFYASDYAGNSNSASSSFSVSTSVPPVNPPSGGSTGGGSSGGGSTINASASKGIEISKISNLIVNPGDSKKIILSIKNIGKSFLNDCKIKGIGENSGWISSTDVKGLSAGEKKDFIFTLNIPETLETGAYNIDVSVLCQEHNESTSFVAEIIEKKLAVDLINVERTSRDKLKVIYSLAELSGFNQEAEVEIVLFGFNNERLAEATENRSIESSSTKQFEAVLSISESLEGNFNLLINAISETSSTFVQEEIILGASPIGGFAIFGGNTGDTVFSIILVALFVIFSAFILRRILKLRKLNKHIDFKNNGSRKGAMMIDGRIVEKLKKQLEGQNHKGKWIHVIKK